MRDGMRLTSRAQTGKLVVVLGFGRCHFNQWLSKSTASEGTREYGSRSQGGILSITPDWTVGRLHALGARGRTPVS